ncbi:Vacuolar protein sorting-associated protein 41 [Ancistrocladus abbreviatus]
MELGSFSLHILFSYAVNVLIANCSGYQLLFIQPPLASLHSFGVTVSALQGPLEQIVAYKSSYKQVGSRYLDHLIVERKYAEAAALCPKLLRGSAAAWERWVFHFAQLRQLPILVPHLPTENPRLTDTVYELALVALVTSPAYHKDLLLAVKSWPRTIYSALPVISAIEPQLKTSSVTDTLKEALAELYVIDGQYESAFSLFADNGGQEFRILSPFPVAPDHQMLLKPDVFDFIEKHNMHDAINEKAMSMALQVGATTSFVSTTGALYLSVGGMLL